MFVFVFCLQSIIIIIIYIKKAIAAGTPLSGKVIVQVDKGADKCNKVMLEVTGKEKTEAYKNGTYDEREKKL